MTTTVDRIDQIKLIRRMASDFAVSLCRQFDRNGALSELQWGCITNMIERANRPTITLDFAAIIALFNLAADSLKYPKIALALRDGTDVVLSRAGIRASRPGTINVTNGRRYGDDDNVWYGRIELDGTFQDSQAATDELRTLLVAFSADPSGVAAAYGKLTGNCCFCRRGLTDERSTDVGYGPVCAKNYGLNWGVKLVTPTPESRAFEAAFDSDKVVA